MKCVEMLCLTLALGLWTLLTGCGSPAGSPPPPAAPAVDAAAKSPSEASNAPGGLMAKDVPGAAKADVANGLAELSPEDRAAAIKQGVCPVSGEPLGSMGKPAKVTVKGQTVFLCCPGCEEDLRKEPDKFLAKLKSGRGK